MSQIQTFTGGSAPGTPNIEFVAGNGGVPIGPNPATFVINIIGDTAQGVTVDPGVAPYTEIVSVQDATAAATVLLALKGVSSYNSADFTVTSGFVSLVNPGTPEWTPFVVDASGNAPYLTIQAALDAANTAGYKLVLVHYGAGNYVEDLTLYDEITVMGIQEDVDSPIPILITGTHTPPASGSVCFVNFRMNDATAIISSAAAITTRISFMNCSVGVTNGFTCDITASTGTVLFEDCSFSGLDDGLVNNATGTATIIVNESTVGGGGQILVTSGNLQVKNSTINCECSFTNAASVTLSDSVMQGMTFANTSTLTVVGGSLNGASKPSITQSSSGAISLVNVAIDSNNNPAIDGAGAGVITLAGVPFLNNTVIAGTLTTAVYDWKPYGTAGNSSTATKGTASFDSDDFTVTNGFVEIKGANVGTGQTINATTDDVITIPLGGVAGTFQIEARCKGFESTTPAGCGYNIYATFTTTGGAATLVGNQDVYNEDVALASADAYFIASGNNAVLQVIGVAGLTIDWSAEARIT